MQTELSSSLFLQKCCDMQMDSVSSTVTEQMHNHYTQTDPVSVLVSQCMQTELGKELYPGQLSQTNSLAKERNCLEESSYKNSPCVDW